ncbi:adenylate/guanylate cyclase domain-containing protein [Lewinella sp. LCG006]|uniref:adenylate/guanylate cyclase domain-containing protein n=1 Tax=Lewinella sp. LCG006 TaxID=3231911 RepID=UPI0034615DE8
MRRYAFILGVLLCGIATPAMLVGQGLDTDLEVYEFSDGLSHRNVFKITQDTTGMIWLATINGLNSFDGYAFRTYNPGSVQGKLPVEMVADIVLSPDQQFVLASPDFLTTFVPEERKATARQIKPGALVRRESWAPHNLCFVNKQLWCTVYDEKDGQNWLAKQQNGQLQLLRKLPGSGTQKPLTSWRGHLVMASSEDNKVEIIATNGNVLRTLEVGTDTLAASPVAALFTNQNELWILLEDGRIYVQTDEAKAAVRWGTLPFVRANAQLAALLVEDDQDVWVGGFGTLWYYDHWQKSWVDYDQSIRQELKNTCTYRQVYQDYSGAIWLATDFGALKITQSDRLFDHYLSGGSEYCSNVYCSIRGMTEDEKGNVYFSYYNSLHVLNAETQLLRPLFPRQDYFNYPFGIAYAKGALFTGNGIRIDLATMQIDTLFAGIREDRGAVLVDQEGDVWIGYDQQLYRYDDIKGVAKPVFTNDSLSIKGTISYLFQGTESKRIWIATLDNGLYGWDIGDDLPGVHYSTAKESPVVLPHQQINVVLSLERGVLWLGTALGLVKLDLNSNNLEAYTQEQGLPNDFINGVLPEGDSCLWVSTDNGLSRINITNGRIFNFSVADGLSANEFNRMSFFKAKNGRFYFGGLNGVNTFLPDERYRAQKDARRSLALVLTSFSYLDGQGDSLRTFIRQQQSGIAPFTLTHRDRMFTAEFALMDYRNPAENTFQYYLEGYDEEWSSPSNVPMVRFSDLKPGSYTLHVRARSGREAWGTQEITVPIRIQPALYQRFWFWPLIILLSIVLAGGLTQYRVYALQKRREELEAEVANRTQELEAEKEKSEELLLNILPAELAQELKENGFAKAKRHERVTVMFSDFKGFTAISEQLEPEQLVAEIDLCFRAFDEITERHGLEKIKTIGDAYLMVGGISQKAEDQARRVVMAALEIQEFMKAIAVERKLHNRHFFEARIGIHTGPLVAGIVGIKKFAYDIWGDTVNIASRMETNGVVGEVNLSETTYDLVKEDFRCKLYGRYSENNTELKMFLVEEYTR